VAEQEREGGVSPHVAPMVGVRDAGDLLSRAGLSLPTVDRDEIVIMFDDALSLMHNLRGMGASSCMTGRRDYVPRETILAAAAIYETMYGTPDGIPATFEMITMTGWKPHDSQPKPMERGTAQVSMADLAKNLGKNVKHFEDED